MNRNARLPWLGLGLSTNCSASDHPDPHALLDRFDYLEYSAPIDFERALAEASLFPEMVRRRAEVPLLFHPVELNLYGPELEGEEKLAKLDEHLKRVGSPWVGNDVAWWHSRGRLWPGYQYVAPPFDRQGLEDCAAHAAHVQGALSVPLLLENPAVIARRGDLHVLDFMAELHARTGCMLLLDLGHLLSFQLTSDLAQETGLDGFPLDAVAELHIAGGMVASRGARTVYFDAHAEPVREELFELLESIVPRCPSLRAVTYEADGHPEAQAAANLDRLRAIVPKASKTPLPIELPDAARGQPSLEAWNVALSAYAGEGDDPASAELERDYRLAIAAKEIDPGAAELLAPRLVEFARAPELREGIAAGRPMRESFVRWAARRLRADPGR
jgi:uncharacterized protein (UPF0276 family)